MPIPSRQAQAPFVSPPTISSTIFPSSPRRLPLTGPHRPAVQNRVRVLMIHAPRYGFQGQARLAADAGVSRSTISRLISGRLNPSFRLAQAVTAALERRLNRSLDLRDLFSPDGTYPTASGCTLAGCRGCLPEEAYDAEGNLRPEYRDMRPGDWSLAKPSQPQTP